MKKVLALLMTAMLVMGMVLSASALTSTNSTATYASVRPVIDGEIDEIWNYAEAQPVPDISDIKNSYTKLLWTERGIYLLAYVEDASITENDVDARNSVDFWVSEKNTQEMGFDTDPGDWHFCKASDGTEKYYTGNEAIYSLAESAVKRTDKGYVVEIFAPFLSDINAKVGTVIGYTVSINDDADDDGVRDEYTFWATSDDNEAYWANTLALCDVTFVLGPDASIFEKEEAPAEEVPEVVPTVEETTDAPVSTVVAPAPKTGDNFAAIVLMVLACSAVVVRSKTHR